MADFDHWMKWNVGDYLADTMHLTTLQHGIYVRLIMHYFKRGPLPNDEKTLARIAGLSTMLWRKHSPQVIALFVLEKTSYLHTRIERTRAEAQRLTERKREKDRLRSQVSEDSRVRVPHNDSQSEKERKEDNPPVRPPKGGPRARRSQTLKPSRQAFADMAREMIDEDAGDPRVVPIRRVGR